MEYQGLSGDLKIDILLWAILLIIMGLSILRLALYYRAKPDDKFEITERYDTYNDKHYTVRERYTNFLGGQSWRTWMWEYHGIRIVDTYSAIEEIEEKIKKKIKERSFVPKVIKRCGPFCI